MGLRGPHQKNYVPLAMRTLDECFRRALVAPPCLVAMRIEANEDRCVGAGQCVRTAPGVFDQDEDGVVVAVAPHPEPALRDLVRAAAYLCPVGAITLHDS